MGDVKKPITAYVRKPGVDYGGARLGRRGRVDGDRGARARRGARPLTTRRRGGLARAGLSGPRAPRAGSRRAGPRAAAAVVAQAAAGGPATELDVTLNPGGAAHPRARAPARRQRSHRPLNDRPLVALPECTRASARMRSTTSATIGCIPGGFSSGAMRSRTCGRRRACAGRARRDTRRSVRVPSRWSARGAAGRRARAVTVDVDFDTRCRAATARSAATAPAAG